MDLAKGSLDGQVNKVIDQAAVAAKKQIGGIMGNQKKDQKQAGGVGDMVTGVATKAAADHAANKAAEQAIAAGKKLLG
ncbi:hypothetical protein Q7C36_002646 [Tachysurus vachellii]|uniref:Uncharacterized protein n=1 Tax=Tachysurus vachellii TaxID=175792 RepID=A0AA88NZ97_TACVA|nr:hypothetical protein Q7C36_002646 [Tachysurus vachellii]